MTKFKKLWKTITGWKQLKSLKIHLPIPDENSPKELKDAFYTAGTKFIADQIISCKKQNACAKSVVFKDDEDKPTSGMIIFYGREIGEILLAAVEKYSEND